jgi:hypothetical protein
MWEGDIGMKLKELNLLARHMSKMFYFNKAMLPTVQPYLV